MRTLVTIEVDVDNLWKTQKPFKVYSAEYMQGVGEQEGNFFKGFVIKMEIDPRDLEKFKFAAYVYNDTTVAVTAPALDYHDAGGDKDAEEAVIEQKPDPRGDNFIITSAFTHGRLEYNELKIPNTMTYHLKFSGGNTILRSDVLLVNEGQRDSRLYLDGINLCVNVPLLDEHAVDAEGNVALDEEGNPIVERHGQYWVGSLLWRVANIAKPTRKHYVGNAEAPTDAWNAMFGNMRVG
jgi:hypothetical protein